VVTDSSGTKTSAVFRGDIQGLRGLAVILVLIFHAFPGYLSGGFVGVDVFFVISGFLITSLLVREIENTGQLKFLHFYMRRIRRLAPAATLTLALAGIASFIWLPEVRWRDTGLEVFASAFYFENMFLYFKSLDYLAADYVASPFQHYWSLSIEEQFYVFWPAFLALTFAAGKKFGMKFRSALFITILFVTITGQCIR